MPIEREELLNQARREREALGRTIQYARAERWDSPSPCPGWRNRDVLAHLASDDTTAAALLAGEPTTELDEFRAAGGDWDDYNDLAVARRAELPFRQVVTDWGHAADQILVRAAKIPAEEWDDVRVDWFGDEIPISELIQSRISEWWLHGEHVRAGADLAPRIEHWPIYLSNDLSIRRLPVLLESTGRTYFGKSVRVYLGGAGGGLWYQALAPGEIAWRGGADVLVEGNAHAFALMAGGAVSPDDLLDSGDLVLSGDDEIGIDILENIRPWL